MIPKIIHYCWFGKGPMPESALRCIESWHRFMPDYIYRLWNEENFSIDNWPYAKEAYECGKYAFVSDVARLQALSEEGGLYFDVDFMVLKPFDDLLSYRAFAGFEGSKYNPVMMGVLGSEPGGAWVTEQLDLYKGRHFLLNGKEDLTTNVKFITEQMKTRGFKPDGKEQEYLDLHIFPVDYFCPRLTSGEYKKTENTYCESLMQASSWASGSWKSKILRYFSPSMRTKLIQMKRRILG